MTVELQAHTLGQLHALVGGELYGDPNVMVTSVTGLDNATSGSLVRVEEPKYLSAALEGRASALLVDSEVGPVDQKPCILVQKVKLAYARILALYDPERHPSGIHPTAIIAETASVDPTARIGPYVVVGEHVVLGPRVVLYPHTTIGDDCEVGADTVFFGNCVVYARSVFGERVRVHAGAVIGADGYGYEFDGQQHVKIPQIGRVRVEDDVEIGANTTIDRATTGETVIGAGTKLDNQVQIAHNVRLGRNCIIVSQVGIAGSSVVGNGVVMGGQAGVRDHVTIGDGCYIAARAGVWKSHPAGEMLSGSPERPHWEQMRVILAMDQLPTILTRMRQLEKRLKQLEAPEVKD